MVSFFKNGFLALKAEVTSRFERGRSRVGGHREGVKSAPPIFCLLHSMGAKFANMTSQNTPQPSPQSPHPAGDHKMIRDTVHRVNHMYFYLHRKV